MGWDSVPTTGLGVCVGTVALVPGDVEGIRGFAGQLTRLAMGADRVEALLLGVEAGRWSGSSGEAFRAAADAQPAPWGRAAAVFGEVSHALSGYASAIEGAREVAQRAMLLWEDGLSATRGWEAALDRYELQTSWLMTVALPGAAALVPPTPHDPGEPLRRRAQRLYDDALAEVGLAAQRSVGLLRDGVQQVPSPAETWRAFGRGAVDSVVGTGTLAWRLSGGALIDPDDSARAYEEVLTGAWTAVTQPLTTVRQLNDQLLEGDPGYLAGSLVPALVGGGVPAAARGAARAPAMGGSAPPGTPQTVPEVREDAPVYPNPLPAGLVPLSPEARRDFAHRIASGHAWTKHRADFPWIASRQHFEAYLAHVLSDPSARYEADGGRGLFWDDRHGIFVVTHPGQDGTAFGPWAGYDYFERETVKSRRRMSAQ